MKDLGVALVWTRRESSDERAERRRAMETRPRLAFCVDFKAYGAVTAHPRTKPSDHCSEKRGKARPSFVESVTSPKAALITLAFPESNPFSPLAKTIPQNEFESPPKRRMEQATPRRPASNERSAFGSLRKKAVKLTDKDYRFPSYTVTQRSPAVYSKYLSRCECSLDAEREG